MSTNFLFISCNFHSFKMASNGINFDRKRLWQRNASLIFIKIIKSFPNVQKNVMRKKFYVQKIHIRFEEKNTLI